MGTESVNLKFWAIVAALFLATAVIIGAFGAHALSSILDAKGKEIYRTANFYHFVHALGLLLLIALPETVYRNRDKSLVAVFLSIGIVLFSGSLYALACTGISFLGAITPLGGLAFISAWGLLAWRLLRN